MFSVHHFESISIALLLVEIWIRWIYKSVHTCMTILTQFSLTGELSQDVLYRDSPGVGPPMTAVGCDHRIFLGDGCLHAHRTCLLICCAQWRGGGTMNRVRGVVLPSAEYKLLGCTWCHKQSRENSDLSNIDMQEAPDFLLPIEFSGSFLHLSDDGHLTVELQQVRPRYLHLPGGSILQAV